MKLLKLQIKVSILWLIDDELTKADESDLTLLYVEYFVVFRNVVEKCTLPFNLYFYKLRI